LRRRYTVLSGHGARLFETHLRYIRADHFARDLLRQRRPGECQGAEQERRDDCQLPNRHVLSSSPAKGFESVSRQAAGTKTYYDACPVPEHQYVEKLNFLPAAKIMRGLG
jgi:hypothetical protein